MKTLRQLMTCTLCAGITLFSGGCATSALWDESIFQTPAVTRQCEVLDIQEARVDEAYLYIRLLSKGGRPWRTNRIEWRAHPIKPERDDKGDLTWNHYSKKIEPPEKAANVTLVHCQTEPSGQAEVDKAFQEAAANERLPCLVWGHVIRTDYPDGTGNGRVSTPARVVWTELRMTSGDGKPTCYLQVYPSYTSRPSVQSIVCTLLLPVAFAVDVVSFPIQAAFVYSVVAYNGIHLGK